MEKKAAEKLGEEVEMTTVVSPKGQGKKMMTAGVARQVAGLAGSMAAEKAMNRQSQTGLLGELKGGYMVLALTPTRLAFFQMKRGLLKNSPGDLLAQCARTEVTSFTVGGGTLTSEVTIGLADGTVLELETPRAQKGKTEKLAARVLSPES